MLVLGDVGEVGEIAERANDRDRLGRVEPGEGGFQFRLGRVVLVAVKPDRYLTDALDDIENRFAILGLNDVAQQAAEKTDVVEQRRIFFRIATVRWLLFGAGGHWLPMFFRCRTLDSITTCGVRAQLRASARPAPKAREGRRPLSARRTSPNPPCPRASRRPTTSRCGKAPSGT